MTGFDSGSNIICGAAHAIEDVEPWSVPYGTRDVAIAVTGTGFTEQPVVVFQGETYRPSVNPAGTRLDVTVATRSLAMGAYPLTVSNGPEYKATLKKALVAY